MLLPLEMQRAPLHIYTYTTHARTTQIIHAQVQKYTTHSAQTHAKSFQH